jgi:nucleotide-binding universal stress UspA family protein
MNSYRKILIVMDESKEVLRQGIRLARDEKARVTVLKMMGPWEGDLPLTDVKRLHALLGDDSPLSADIADNIRVLSGYSTDSILELAEEEQCDLIMMATRKKKGILGRIFGDYTLKKVMGHVACPVYVIGSSCEPMPETVHSERLEVEIFA